MAETMTFPEYRELLVHINKEHSPNKHVESGRQVKHIKCITDMRTGTVGHVKIYGHGWEKTIHITGTGKGEPLLARCHRFLDDETEEVDLIQEDRMHSAVAEVQKIILGELGRNSLIYGEEFGAKELKVTIPLDVLKAAIEETDREQSRDGADGASSNTGKSAGGHGDAAGASDRA